MLLRSDAERDGFVREIAERLMHQQNRSLQKEASQCKAWQGSVYKPVQSQIDRQLQALPDKELGERRCASLAIVHRELFTES